jgi:predicted RNase H-like HicB family nuclease
MTSYIFKVVIEPDEDRWHAYCPALVERGAATWGATRGEALANIEDVVKIVVASMLEHGGGNRAGRYRRSLARAPDRRDCVRWRSTMAG